MPNADALTFSSYQQRKDAVLRAARLISCFPGSDSEREFEMLTEAIANLRFRGLSRDFCLPPSKLDIKRSARVRP